MERTRMAFPIGALIALALVGLGLVTAPGLRQPSRNVSSPRIRGAATSKPDAHSTPGRAAAGARLREGFGQIPLSFEANRGQTDARVKFLSRGRGYTLFLTGDETVLSLRREGQKSKVKGQKAKLEDRLPSLMPRLIGPPKWPTDDEPQTTGSGRLSIANRQSTIGNSPESRSVVRLKLLGANPKAKVVGLDPLPGKSNYFLGNDPKKWRTNVPNYSKVKYQNIYPGIDLVYYGHERELEYDFVVAPGADPGALKLAVDGAKDISFDEGGNLVAKSNGGDIVLNKPTIYQNAPTNPKSKNTNPKSVGGRYTLLAKNQVAFEVGPYDRSQPLIIDPVLSYSTYLGGSNDDLGVGYGVGIAVDTFGNVYLTGHTYSTDFPTMTPLQGSNAGGSDAFVTKLNAAGDALVYSTYLGGSSDDLGLALALDTSGNAYLTGYTGSTDFPTMTPLQGSNAGGWDGFVTKLTSAGDALVYSTYLGGSFIDYGLAIAVDTSGNAHLTGSTGSTNFPTMNPLQGSYGGGQLDAFVTELNAAGDALLYSTYLGGSDTDVGYSIAVDTSGNAYVTGSTGSTNFPTMSPLQGSHGGGELDAFVTKLNTVGDALAYSTYLGGNSDELGLAIAVGTSGDAYLVGATVSTNFPTMNPLQGPHGGVYWDAFVTKLNSTGDALAYSTYLGGSDTDVGYSIAVDTSGNAYVTGSTRSTDFPTMGPLQVAFAGGDYDAFVSKLDAAGDALLYSTYLGGSGRDEGDGVAVDSSGNIYVTGNTSSTDYPATSGAPQPRYGGGYMDGFVAKISPNDGSLPVFTPTTLAFSDQLVGASSPAQTVRLGNLGSALLTIWSVSTTGDFGQTNNCGGGLTGGGNCTITVTFTPTATGARNGTVTIDDDAPSSPHTLPLSGTGIAPAVTLSTTSLTFADQIVGTTSAPQPVTLTNSGIGALSVSIAAGGDFAQANDCGSTVAEGANCTIGVTFMPTFPGQRVGSVTITDNAPGSPQVISLSGNGIGSTLNFSSTSLTFTDQLVGTTSPPQIVTLTNNGPGPVTISSVAATGDFAEVSNCPTNPATLAASASCQFNVTFTPTAPGNRTGAITITDNALGSPHVISLAGTGIAPAANLAPASLNFPDQTVGVPSPPQPVALSNTGSAALTINGIVASSNFGQTNNCGVSLAAGASCTINVTFTASVMGTTFGSLSILDSAQGSPHAVSLVGTSGVGFGSQLVGTTSSSQTAMVTNTGTTTLHILGIATSGDFSQTNNCGSTLGPGGSCSVSVTFAPTASGNRTGALTTNDDAGGGLHSFALSGTGTDFALAAGAGSSTSATVTAGGTATYNLSIAPTGFAGTVSLACAGAPRAATCTTSTTSLAVDGVNPATFSVSVKTTARAMAPYSDIRFFPMDGVGAPLRLVWLMALMTLLGAAAMWRQKMRSGGTPALQLFPFGVLLLFVLLWSACGGGGPANLGTPRGTYTLTVTATYGSASRSLPLTLTVN